jgi:RimJ/RimL family protein N-acetyltransferase
MLDPLPQIETVRLLLRVPVLADLDPWVALMQDEQACAMSSVIAPDNLASQRVALRPGSSNLGPTKLPAPHADARGDLWGQASAQWLARRAAGLPAIAGQT